MTEQNITVAVDSSDGIKELLRVVGTVAAFGGIGAIGYALAQAGLLEVAAALITATAVAFVRLLVANGIVHFRLASDKASDFAATRGLLATAIADYRTWIAQSPVWRLMALAIAYGAAYTAVMWSVRYLLTMITSPWLIGGLCAIFASVVIAPQQVSKIASAMKGGAS